MRTWTLLIRGSETQLVMRSQINIKYVDWHDHANDGNNEDQGDFHITEFYAS